MPSITTSEATPASTKQLDRRAHISKATLFLTTMLALLLLCPAPMAIANDAADFRDITITPALNGLLEQHEGIRADAAEVENILGIHDLVDRIRTAAPGLPSRSTQAARVICLWKLFMLSEEIRATNARIDFELAIANSELDALSARQLRAIDLLNTANFIQGGVIGVTKNSMALREISPRARQVQAIDTFSTGIFLSTLNLLVPYALTQQGDTHENSLQLILGSKAQTTSMHPYLDRFLNSPVPGSDVTLDRREILKRHWTSFAGLSANESSQARVSARGDLHYRQNLGLLMQRIALLQDLKTHIEELDGSIYELYKVISRTEGT